MPLEKAVLDRPKNALRVAWRNLPVTLKFAANDPLWALGCSECRYDLDYRLTAITSNVQDWVYQYDLNSNIEAITNSSGTVVWQQHPTPFGEIQETIATGIENLKSFPGQYRDSDTGYSYNYYRDYDPTIGRYVQSDPIGLNGGLNTYGYALQNPLIYIDPFGLSSLTPLPGSDLCKALQELANNPNNRWVQGNGEFSFDALGTEQLPGGNIVFDGVDIQYVQTSYAFSNSGGTIGRQFSGLGSIVGHSYYSLIFGIGVSGSSLAETATDMRGTLLGNEISLYGNFNRYVKDHCGCEQ